MASPTVGGVASASFDTSTTSFTVSIPAGTGGRFYVLLSQRISGASWTTPTGTWSHLYDSVGPPQISMDVYSKDDESESGSFTFTSSASNKGGVICVRVNNGDSSGEGLSTTATGNSANPDPNSASITSADALAIAATGFNNNPSISTWPTNYSDNQTEAVPNGTGNPAGCALATRALTSVTSEDPGSFTLSASNTWGAITILIPEAAGGGGLGIPIAMHHYRQLRAG